MKNLLQTDFERRILQKMVNPHSCCNKRIYYSDVNSSFKKQALGGKVYI